MSRIVRTDDGTIYLLRLRFDRQHQAPEWVLTRRDAKSTAWHEIATGPTSDEAHLLLANAPDNIHIIAYPNGLPASWSTPSLVPHSIPGDWQQLSSRSRHYGSAGIGRDGTLCLKASRESNVASRTLATSTEYSCASGSKSGSLSWGPFVSHQSGERYAYDYIFPGIADGFYGSAQSDLQKDAAGYPALVGFPYVLNGVQGYSSGLATDAMWKQEKIHAASRVPNASTATVSPSVTQIDAFVDSSNRAFSIAHRDSTDGKSARENQGSFLTVTDPSTGARIYSGKLNLPTYGTSRLLEDARARLWLLWTNAGTQQTEIRVYRLFESVQHQQTRFDLGTGYDLSRSFSHFAPGWSSTPYEVYGPVYVAAPRGGTLPSRFIDGYMNMCATQFSSEDVSSRPDYDSKRCFGSDGREQMPVIYFRIELPD